MALLDFLRTWRTTSKIRSLETQLRGRPAPQVYLKLADAYIDARNLPKAVQILKMGASRFPSAPEIGRRQAQAEKILREGERRRLQDKIQTHPNPILYARLAELYKADNDIDRTIQICQAGVKAFPRYGGTYLVLGQIYAEKRKWNEAVQQLEKSVELDKYNYMALKLLAQVYLQLKRPADAVKRLEEILYFAPGDETIQELAKKARQEAGASEAPAFSDTSVSLASVSGERKGVSVPKPRQSTSSAGYDAGAGAPTSKSKMLSDGVSGIRAVSGVLGAMLVDQYGLVVAADLGGILDEGLAGALITNVFRTTHESADKLGVGTFEESVIEGESGSVHVAKLDDTILAVFVSKQVKLGLLQKHIRDFAMAVMKAN